MGILAEQSERNLDGGARQWCAGVVGNKQRVGRIASTLYKSHQHATNLVILNNMQQV